MRIGIYCEPSGGSLGGAESAAIALGVALAAEHEVDFVHHREGLSRTELERHAGCDLRQLSLRHVAPARDGPFGSFRHPAKWRQQARDWHRALSEPYDRFVNFAHGIPPFAHAGRSVLVVLFPLFRRPFVAEQPRVLSREGILQLWRVKRAMYERDWAARLASYDAALAISRFTQEWTLRRWGLPTKVVYPPVICAASPGLKQDLVLSIGRFTSVGHGKKQKEMVGAFRAAQAGALRDWRYACVGSLGTNAADLQYHEDVRTLAAGSGVEVLANAPNARLQQLLSQAKIFWHAAGHGESDDRPELAEHFGIATVEAMAAGCVPVVANRGGQREIVEHGESGFLWNTLQELEYYTQLLAMDDRLRRRLAERARMRAGRFGRQQFVSALRAQLALDAAAAPDRAHPDCSVSHA